MAQADLYLRIFDYTPTNVTSLLLTDPAQASQAAASPAIAAWALLVGSMHLRRVGQHSPANDWLNHASRLNVQNDVFRAELLGEAGQGLFEGDRLQDAYGILNSALATWRDVCDQAERACAGPASEAATEFAAHLLPLFAAAGAEPPASEADIRSGAQAVPVVKQWLTERAVMGRAQTANTFLRLLARAGQIDDARRILTEELEWVARRFTSPAEPLASGAIEKRSMASAVRRAVYLLLLARGEIELAAEDLEASAAGFAAAATVYEGQAQDYSDINRLLRAKFNQANSLLRLQRVDEAIGIYELCQHGFHSIGDAEAAQRVDHAILFARSMEDDES